MYPYNVFHNFYVDNEILEIIGNKKPLLFEKRFKTNRVLYYLTNLAFRMISAFNSCDTGQFSFAFLAAS